jgi:hypothetical protein
MEHHYTYPTVIPLPRATFPGAAAHELDGERRAARARSDQAMSGGAGPERYASSSSGGSDRTAS